MAETNGRAEGNQKKKKQQKRMKQTTNSLHFCGKPSNVLETFQQDYELGLVLQMVSASVRSFFIRCMSVWMLVVQVESQTKSKLEVMYKRLNRQLVKKGGNQKKVSRYMMYVDT